MAYADVIIADSPVAYWRLGDGTGTSESDEVGSNTLDTTALGTGSASAAGLLSGDSDTCWEFDGDSTLVGRLSPTGIDNFLSGGGTIEFLINPDSDGEGNAGRVVEKVGQWLVFVAEESGGNMRMHFRHSFGTTEGRWQTQNLEIAVGGFHHCVILYDRQDAAANPRIFVNNNEVTVTESQAPAGLPVNSAGGIIVGNNGLFTGGFDGRIDEVAFYDSELSTSDITTHFNATQGIFPDPASGLAGGRIGTSML